MSFAANCFTSWSLCFSLCGRDVNLLWFVCVWFGLLVGCFLVVVLFLLLLVEFFFYLSSLFLLEVGETN